MSSDPAELMVDAPIVPNPPVPAISEIAIVPYSLTRVMPSAQAAIGNATASNASTAITHFMLFVPPEISSFPQFAHDFLGSAECKDEPLERATSEKPSSS